jgi:hypothetical protein
MNAWLHLQESSRNKLDHAMHWIRQGADVTHRLEAGAKRMLGSRKLWFPMKNVVRRGSPFCRSRLWMLSLTAMTTPVLASETDPHPHELLIGNFSCFPF